MSYIVEAAKAIRSALSEPFSYQIINYGGRAVYVEGFLRVTVIETDKIQFLLKKSVVTVAGKNLTVSALTAGTCLVEGKVESVYES